MTESFADGTVVQLKSGGPLMTVRYSESGGHLYFCEWFVNNELKSELFSGASLSEYRDEE
ncbi:MAG: DUF2158 domain-containing protein [Haemophilus parainfluenzae]|nr:DUF2158 domain-containing protein [Haemophilus parainfluenzae]